MKLAEDSDIARQLADAYTKAGRSKDAIKLLKDWTGKHQDDRGAMASLAILYQAAGQDAEAVKLYEQLVPGRKDQLRPAEQHGLDLPQDGRPPGGGDCPPGL